MTTRLAFSSFLRKSACVALVTAIAPLATAGGIPIGAYVSGPYTLKFEHNGRFRVIKSGVALVEGRYRVSGDQIQLTDKRGPFACTGKGQTTGTYHWKLEAAMLELNNVEDACTDRSQSFAGIPWKKK